MAQYVMSMLAREQDRSAQASDHQGHLAVLLPGAKIGLLGLNGSGKSTVLRIMVGRIKEYDGEVQWLAGQRIGYLPQEPELDPAKTVKEEVEAGARRGDGGAPEAGRGSRRLR